MERNHCQRCGAPGHRPVCGRCESPDRAALPSGRERPRTSSTLPLARQECVGARASVGPDYRFFTAR